MSVWGETILFDHLTPERILSSVESFGYRCTGRIQQLNSMENRVYQVELDLEDSEITNKYSRDVIAKFYRPGRWNELQIREEHQFLFDCIENDVPVVAPLKNSNHDSLAYNSESKLWFCLFPRVGGRVPDEMTDEQVQIMGRLLARLHLTGETKTAQHRVTLNSETYGYNHLEYLRESQTIPLDLSSRYFKAAETILETCTLLYAKLNLQRIHGDCHMGNLLWSQEGPFFVDFDDMVVGPAVQDIWLLTPSRDDYSLRQRNLLVDAYDQIKRFDREELKLVEFLRSLRLIHFSVWIKKRYQDQSFQRAFPDFDSWNYWNQQTLDLEDQLNYIKKTL